jgi:hypothetical protein
MHGTDIHGETEHELPEEAPDFGLLRTRLAWILSVLLLVLLLAFVPPLINVSRFQRRIASNLSASLGRPVHLDRVSLTLLPLPGFTLDNFVVNEDPSFGYEPILRANEVRVTVRISSLWSHHVEFSRITLTEPTSLNLVRLPNGRWNFEPVLLQASRIDAAPTAQTYSGPAPRFPYIEASGARINLKLGQEKTPFALTDSEFSLWLPTARQWRFRLQAHPARTDVSPSDAGILRLEGALGDGSTHAGDLGQVPIDLRTTWQAAPLSGLGRIAFGRDIGVRGDLTLDLHALGTVDNAELTADLKIAHARRADFIPSHLISLDASCLATATGHFQSFTGIECRWPPTPSEKPSLLASGSVPQVSDLHTASASLHLSELPTPVLLDWIQAATPHPPSSFTGAGIVTGDLSWNPAATPTWTGALTLSGESLSLPKPAASKPLPLSEIALHPSTGAAPVDRARRRPIVLSHPDGGLQPRTGFDLTPVSLPLGGRSPATLEGHFDASGYTLHLAGPVLLSRLLALADSIPQFGDGLRALLGPEPSAPRIEPETPIHVDLTATRHWGRPQSWIDNAGSVVAQNR